MHFFHHFVHLRHRSCDPGKNVALPKDRGDLAVVHTHSGLLIPDELDTNHLIQSQVPNLDMGFGKRTKGTFTGSLCLFSIFMTQVVSMIFIKYVIEYVISSNKGTFGAINDHHCWNTEAKSCYNEEYLPVA